MRSTALLMDWAPKIKLVICVGSLEDGKREESDDDELVCIDRVEEPHVIFEIIRLLSRRTKYLS